VNYVKGILQGDQGNIGQTNIDELMRQARQMLSEIMRRDFSQKDREANDEKDRAIEGNVASSYVPSYAVILFSFVAFSP